MNPFERPSLPDQLVQSNNWRLMVAGVAASLMLGFLLAMSTFLSKQAQEFSLAKSDSEIWNIAQVQNAFRKFQIDLTALSIRLETGSDLSEIQVHGLVRSFDIFYARIDTVNTRFQKLNFPEDIQSRLALIVDHRNIMAQSIDANLPAPALIEQLSKDAAKLNPIIQEFALTGMHSAISTKSKARESLHQSLQRYLFVSLAILLVTLIVIMVLLYQWRQIALRARGQQLITSFLATVLESSHDAVFVLDQNLTIIHANSAAERMVGADLSSSLGRSPIELFTQPEKHSEYLESLQNLINSPKGEDGRVEDYLIHGRRNNGDIFPAQFSAVRETGLSGQPILIGFLRDVSEEIAALDSAEKARSRAEHDASAKNRFVATMSHEMRTPLHGVIAALDLARRAKGSDETLGFLNLAQSSAKAALEQIEDVLDITRHDRELETLVSEPFDPRQVTQGIIDQLRPIAVQKGNDIAFSWEGPSAHIGYRRAFSKAVYNLISNAIKFTQDGQITVAGKASLGEDGHTVLSVTDSGPGIDPQESQRIFEDFYTKANTDKNSLPSTGLGLGIVLRSMAAMGGTVTLDSALGKGAKFTLTFPAIVADAETALSSFAGFERHQDGEVLEHTSALPELSHAGCAGIERILIVEDHPTNRLLLCRMLADCGAEIHEAKDGFEAVQKAYETPFDLILTDINMPNLSGLDAADRIRTLSRSSQACIIAVTAQTSLLPDDIVGILDHGVDGVIQKPFTAAQLMKRIASILEEKAEMPADASGGLDCTTTLLQTAHRFSAASKASLDIAPARELARIIDTLDGLLLAPEGADFDALANLAHYTASGLFSLSASSLGNLLIDIEDLSRAHNRAALKACLYLLKREHKRLSETKIAA